MNKWFKDRVLVIVMTIWQFILNISFEVIYLKFKNIGDINILYPINFFLFLIILNFPISHRIMSILEKYNCNNKLFDLGKIVLDIYFVFLFVNTLYCSDIILLFRWFCLFFAVLYTLSLVNKISGETRVLEINIEDGLTFQLTCIEYWILMISICSLGNNLLSIIIVIMFLFFSLILRGISLFSYRKKKNIGIQFILATIIEYIAFALFIIGVPFDNIEVFYHELYINNPKFYIDMLMLLIICSVLEFPMHHIRNMLCRTDLVKKNGNMV